MADAKASTFSKITPVLTDYLMAIDAPGGTPANANVEITDLLTLLKASTDTYYFGNAGVARVTSDFTKTEDTTLANVTGLSHTLAAGGWYHFRAYLMLSCHASGGQKTAISGACTATAIQFKNLVYTASAIAVGDSTALDSASGSTLEAVLKVIEGYINVNAGGTITVQFAQNASYATASKVLKGSFFEVRKLA
jgi:hypothetical protein